MYFPIVWSKQAKEIMTWQRKSEWGVIVFCPVLIYVISTYITRIPWEICLGILANIVSCNQPGFMVLVHVLKTFSTHDHHNYTEERVQNISPALFLTSFLQHYNGDNDLWHWSYPQTGESGITHHSHPMCNQRQSLQEAAKFEGRCKFKMGQKTCCTKDVSSCHCANDRCYTVNIFYSHFVNTWTINPCNCSIQKTWRLGSVLTFQVHI